MAGIIRGSVYHKLENCEWAKKIGQCGIKKCNRKCGYELNGCISTLTGHACKHMVGEANEKKLGDKKTGTKIQEIEKTNFSTEELRIHCKENAQETHKTNVAIELYEKSSKRAIKKIDYALISKYGHKLLHSPQYSNFNTVIDSDDNIISFYFNKKFKVDNYYFFRTLKDLLKDYENNPTGSFDKEIGDGLKIVEGGDWLEKKDSYLSDREHVVYSFKKAERIDNKKDFILMALYNYYWLDVFSDLNNGESLYKKYLSNNNERIHSIIRKKEKNKVWTDYIANHELLANLLDCYGNTSLISEGLFYIKKVNAFRLNRNYLQDQVIIENVVGLFDYRIKETMEFYENLNDQDEKEIDELTLDATAEKIAYDMFVKAIIGEYDEKEFNGYTFDVRLYEWVQFFKKILKMIFDGRLCRKYQSIKEEDLEEELEELIWEEVQSEIEIVSDWECNISEIKVTETRNRDTICGIVEGDYSFLRYVEEDDDWKKVIEVAEECYRYQESGNVDYCFEMVFNKELSKYNIRLLEKNG